MSQRSVAAPNAFGARRGVVSRSRAGRAAGLRQLHQPHHLSSDDRRAKPAPAHSRSGNEKSLVQALQKYLPCAGLLQNSQNRQDSGDIDVCKPSLST
jgi:hypothetical protein